MGRVLELWENLTGAVIPFAGAQAPSGFLLCDGSLKDVADYPNLFEVIGSTFNTGGEAAGKFRVPDMRGRVVAGMDNMGGTAANRLTAAGVNINASTLGASGGTQTHILSAAQMPRHNHGVTDPGHNHVLTDPGHQHTLTDPGHSHGINDPGHAHSVYDPGHTHGHNAAAQVGGSSTGGGAFPLNAQAGATINAAVTNIAIYSAGTGITAAASGTGITVGAKTTGITAASATSGITTQEFGNGDAHPNVQPTLVLNYIIKT